MSKAAPKKPITVDSKLLGLLVCPVTKTTLSYDAKKQKLISKAANLAYPIKDGIPILIPEEAEKLSAKTK